MSKINFNRKQRFFFDLHSLFMLRLMSGEFEMTLDLIESAMLHHNVRFKKPVDIDPEFTVLNVEDMLYSFGEVINSTKYNDFSLFAYICEGFMDVSAVAAKDYKSVYARPHKVAAIAERVGNVTIVTPVNEDLAKAS